MDGVVIFSERLAEIAEKCLKKGAKVYLKGALQTRKWTDQGGQERYTTEIVLNRFRGELTMLDGAGGARGIGRRWKAGMTRVIAAALTTSRHRAAPAARARTRVPVNDLDDDIPF